MKVYLCMIAMTALFGLCAGRSVQKGRIAYGWTLAILAVWVFVYAFRYNTGTDFEGYHYFYNRIGELNQTFEEFVGGQRDFLFARMEYYIYQLSGGSWIAFSLVLGILTYLPVLIVIRDESPSVLLSSLLFIFTTQYYSGFNGIRQAIAVAFTFYAYYKLFLKGKYLLYALVMLAAFGFHSTALIAIPYHFLSKLGVRSKVFWTVGALMLLSYVYLWEIWDHLIDFLEMIGQNKLAEDYANATENGSGMLRAVVHLLPALVGMLYCRQLEQEYKHTDKEIMMILISGIFLVFSTKYWLFSRVASYFNMHSIMLLPKLESAFTQNSKRSAMVLMAALYFAYMCAMLLHGDGGCLPYTFYPL